MQIRFRAVTEQQPGQVWKDCAARSWLQFLDWFLLQGDAARPSYLECRRALRKHVPKLVPLWQQLVDLAGGGDQAARALSMWRPSPYLTGCSQAVWNRGDSFLIRNYDYSPDAIEGTVLHSRWQETAVVASLDCLWGVLDGMNEHGLCVALAFAGRRNIGVGFGIPLLLRYVLQQCVDVESAAQALCRLPSHMAYHVTLLDAAGNCGRVSLGGDRKATFTPHRVATNHGDVIEWPEYVKATRSVERYRALEKALTDRTETAERFIGRFLRPPLFQFNYKRGCGTLYTAVYRPKQREVELVWPDLRWSLGLNNFHVGERIVSYRSMSGT